MNDVRKSVDPNGWHGINGRDITWVDIIHVRLKV